jgi:DNA-binding SARP family transcriptional activator
MAEGLEFRVLGPVEALRDGKRLRLGGRRQRALLALLIVEGGRPVPTDRLIDELWQGDPPSGASTLPSYVSRLRAALGSPAIIDNTASGYRLNISPERVDAWQIELLASEGQAAQSAGKARRARDRLQAALALWRGRPFGELADEGALRVEAQRLEELRLLALEGRIDLDLALGVGPELIDELESLVRDHPYRERFWAQLMLVLYRAQRQTEALASYQRARVILDEDLGLEPGQSPRKSPAAAVTRPPPGERGSVHGPEVMLLEVVGDLLPEDGALDVGRPEVDAAPDAGVDDLLERHGEAVEGARRTRRG